jgi:hypothetical protein
VGHDSVGMEASRQELRLSPLVHLMDILLIFGKSRRCIHYLIAGTRVVATWSRADRECLLRE